MSIIPKSDKDKGRQAESPPRSPPPSQAVSQPRGRSMTVADFVYPPPSPSRPRGANWRAYPVPPPYTGNGRSNHHIPPYLQVRGQVPNISSMELPGIGNLSLYDNLDQDPSSSAGGGHHDGRPRTQSSSWKGASLSSQRNADRMNPYNSVADLRDNDKAERTTEAEMIQQGLMTNDPNRGHRYAPDDPSSVYINHLTPLTTKSAVLPQGATRYLRFDSVNPQEMDEEVLGKCAIGRLKNVDVMGKVVGIRKLEQYNEYVIRFDDIRDAVAAYNEIKALNRWPVEFVKASYYHNIPGVETPFWTPNESAVVIHTFAANRSGFLASTDIATAVPDPKKELRKVLESQFGDCIQCMYEEETSGAHYISFKVIFYAVTMADTVAREWAHGCSVYAPGTRCIELLLFSRFFESRQNPMCYLAGRTGEVPYHHHSGANSPGNQVDPANILSGRDVRTTVMLRNIPNKFQSFELKRILDWVCKGRFDFSYLRVDFNNRCNVGYAFINFLDPVDIIAFFHALAYCKWNVYNSDKVAQICYATIQGLECLVERFRNSGVITQWAPFRAKTWYTSLDYECLVDPTLVGALKTFPAPNNRVKLQRSLDNAYHVGLFPPRPGDRFWRRANDTDDTESRHLDNRDRRAMTRGSWQNISHLSHATSGPVAPRLRNIVGPISRPAVPFTAMQYAPVNAGYNPYPPMDSPAFDAPWLSMMIPPTYQDSARASRSSYHPGNTSSHASSSRADQSSYADPSYSNGHRGSSARGPPSGA